MKRVYVIGPASGAVKIGIAKVVERRVAELQTGHPYRLVVHYEVECDAAYKVEGFAHWSLKQYRLSGEWFSCAPLIARHAVDFGIERLARGLSLRRVECFDFDPRSRWEFTGSRKSVYTTGMSDCPLLQYLGRREEVPYKFAARARMSQATIYALLNGTYTGVRWETLRLIEEHTGGEVTVQIMSDWLTERLIEKGETNGRSAEPGP